MDPIDELAGWSGLAEIGFSSEDINKFVLFKKNDFDFYFESKEKVLLEKLDKEPLFYRVRFLPPGLVTATLKNSLKRKEIIEAVFGRRPYLPNSNIWLNGCSGVVDNGSKQWLGARVFSQKLLGLFPSDLTKVQ